jgi:anti-sigma B factor antagonist
MKVNIIEKYGQVVLELKGDLIGGPFAEEMNTLLHKFVNDNKKNIVVDLSGVKFVNSSGIGILISGYTTMKNAGGELKLANVNERINGVLSITKLNQVFERFDLK